MDPVLKSILTSALMAVAGSAATWAVTQGIVPASDQSVVVNDLVAAALYGVTGLIGWYKARTQTKDALIVAVNKTDNGVKVVPASSPTPPVNTALK